MKTILLACLAAISLTRVVRAQDFEGTVTWSMRADITDPAMRGQMQAAQAQMGSPEMQAKMKEAQAAMSSPEMQAMLAQNPQMRAMMEKSMSAITKPGGMGGGSPDGLFPKGFVLKAKGARTLVKVEGGMMPSETLTLGDQNTAYQLDREARTYRRISLPADAGAAKTGAAFKITPTTETTKVLGYTCTRYLVEQVGGGEKTAYSVWTTKEIKGLDPKKMSGLQVGRDRAPNFMSQLDGAPLKMEITTPQAKLTMEATAIKPESLADSVFTLPKGFAEAP